MAATASAITKLEGSGKLFAGQGDLVIFNVISDYTGKSLADFSGPKSLGQIVQDSTTWEGEDVSTDQILDEQGNLITARVTAGTLGFSFDIASTSQLIVQTFLAGVALTTNGNPGTMFDVPDGGSVTGTGFGTELPVITRPIALINDEKTRAWVYPKAKITANLAYSDGLYRIHAVVLAEQVEVTGKLYTAMVLDVNAAS